MKETQIYIARHGETEYNRKQRIQGRGIDEPLNKTGHLQARALAEYMQAVGPDKLVSSSLTRARQSAGYVAEYCHLELESYSELDEMNFGILEGKKFNDITEEIEILHKNWNSGKVTYAPENGESPVDVYRRVNQRMQSVLKSNCGKSILFVLHGRLIRIVLSVWLGLGLNRMQEVEHSNAGLNLLTWDGQIFYPKFLNMTSHLKELVKTG